MCGIIGGFDRSGRPFGECLAATACQRIAHRGPDDEGWFEADGILIGNRRLSILDVAGGHQPMFSDDGQIAVVQNGEIYNYLELARGLSCRTQCDTEVILRLYERDGEDFVQQLNGMFAIAILDRRHRRLLLYRDRLGKKPLYLYDDGQRLLFASEIKSLLAMGAAPRLDLDALDAYLTYNYVPPPKTMFAGITQVQPGHYLRLDPRGTQNCCWWQLDVAPENYTEQEWCEAIAATLHDAVRIRLRSDVPLGAFLSGGIDSSLVVRCMSDHMARRVKTFCIGVDNSDIEDARFAELVADCCRTDHTCEFIQADLAATWPLAIYHSDQPHGDTSFLPTYWVCKMARQHVKVALTGDGGDELFAGYDIHRRFLATRAMDQPRSDFERDYVQACSIFTEADKDSLYTDTLHQATTRGGAVELGTQRLARFRQHDPLNQMLGLDLELLLPGNNLVKSDKMSMAVSLETRTPLLDYRLVELAFRIPGSLKLRNGEAKSILKRAAESMLPSPVVHRRKQTFTIPIGEWFRSTLSPLVRQTLLSRETERRGLFNSRQVRRLVDEHESGQHNHTRQLRALIAFELWQRMFLDRQVTAPPTLEDLGVRWLPRPCVPGHAA